MVQRIKQLNHRRINNDWFSIFNTRNFQNNILFLARIRHGILRSKEEKRMNKKETLSFSAITTSIIIIGSGLFTLYLSISRNYPWYINIVSLLILLFGFSYLLWELRWWKTQMNGGIWNVLNAKENCLLINT